jgi:hypothetical protein
MPFNTPQDWIIQPCIEGYYLQNNYHIVFENHFYPYHHINVNLSYHFRSYDNPCMPYRHYHPSRPIYLYQDGDKHYIFSILRELSLK